MDLETASAIESLRQDVERVTADVVDRLAVMDTSLRRQIATTEHALRGEMREMRDEITTTLRAEMRQRSDEVTTTLRAEMHVMRDELSRNTAILTERVRDDIRIVADGLAAVSAKIDALRG